MTLINSVLASLPTHVMYLFAIPSKVEGRLDKLRRNFLWLGIKGKARVTIEDCSTKQRIYLQSLLSRRKVRQIKKNFFVVGHQGEGKGYNRRLFN